MVFNVLAAIQIDRGEADAATLPPRSSAETETTDVQSAMMACGSPAGGQLEGGGYDDAAAAILDAVGATRGSPTSDACRRSRRRWHDVVIYATLTGDRRCRAAARREGRDADDDQPFRWTCSGHRLGRTPQPAAGDGELAADGYAGWLANAAIWASRHARAGAV